MRSLIVYCSAYGTTREAAQLLRNQLKGEVELVNLEYVTNMHITDGFDTVIIGSSIQLGQIHKKIKLFVNENINSLIQKHIGIFLCCLKEEIAETHLNSNFPKEIRERAKTAIIGGKIDFSKLTLFEKFVARNIVGIKEDMNTLNLEKIKVFAAQFNEHEKLVKT